MRFSTFLTRSTILLLSPLLTSALSTPTPIFTLPGPVNPASWFENLAVRPNGNILATRGDAPEIWQIDPATGEGSILATVDGAFNLTGIAQVQPHPNPSPPKPSCPETETYIFGSSYIPIPWQTQPGSAKVWTLHLSNHSTTATTTVSLLAAMPSAGFINGITPWGAGRVLLSDTEAEVIYLMDVATGEFTTPLTGMTGVNGIRASGGPEAGYLYRADILAPNFSRIPVDENAVPTGLAEILAANQSLDDFAVVVDEDGKGRAYLGAMLDNEVVEVEFGVPGSGEGVRRVVAENVSGIGAGIVTVVVLGRREEDAGLLYAAVGQGGGMSATIVVMDPSE